MTPGTLWDDDEVAGKVGRHHPQTSYDAARTAAVKGQKGKLMAALDRSGVAGLTSYEAAAALGVSPNQAATRMMELREAGRVVRLKATRPTTPGNRGHIHVTAAWAHGHFTDEEVHHTPADRVPVAEVRRLAAIGARVEALVAERSSSSNIPESYLDYVLARLVGEDK